MTDQNIIRPKSLVILWQIKFKKIHKVFKKQTFIYLTIS